MHTGIIAGVPLAIDQRIQAALRKGSPFPADWTLIWIRSAKRPGIMPSQVREIAATAETADKPHILAFRQDDQSERRTISAQLVPQFRLRWLDHQTLRLIPHQMDDFFLHLAAMLNEELEWSETVRPEDPSSCLLLPECAFEADKTVRHLWTAATEASIERIRLAALAKERFREHHWTRTPRGEGHSPSNFAWIDQDGRIFDHRGPRHGLSPNTRSRKYSFKIPDRFHYDIKSSNGRAFLVTSHAGARHSINAGSHINLDPYGHVI